MSWTWQGAHKVGRWLLLNLYPKCKNGEDPTHETRGLSNGTEVPEVRS